jgi:hypothetical protein
MNIRLSLITAFLLQINVGFCQEQDSTMINKMEQDSSINKYEYLRSYYEDGVLKEEGWIIWRGSDYYNEHVNSPHKFDYNWYGERRIYRKDGSLKEIDKYDIYGFATGYWIYFGYKGDTTMTQDSYQPKDDFLELQPIRHAKNKGLITTKNYYVRMYYENLIYQEGLYVNDNKEGEWKHFKMGTTELKKTILYKNGKKINVTKTK